ncbi:MAG TPA: hypothetical protein ACHBY4_02115 [Arsenophonus apicola]|jgi:hypothetical protein|uniref:hypothetical protein n=1 Tax=Arsenophonus apicola TaxID=2879119 RepID=UPI0038797345
MKLKLIAFSGLMIVCSAALSAPLQIDEEILKEKAAFSLGVQKDRVIIEESDRTPEKLTEYFNAIYKNKTYQCYVSHLKDTISDAVCRPTDGFDLSK